MRKPCPVHWLGAATLILGLILTLAPVHASSATTLFALVDTGELYASTDGGAVWTVRSTLPVSDAAGLMAGATASHLFLVSRTGTVHASEDAGVTWNATGAVTAVDVADMALTGSGDLLVLTRSGTIRLSADAGVSFSAVAQLTAANCVSLGGNGDGTLLVLTATGVIHRSPDDGASWSVVGAIPVSNAVAIRSVADRYFVLTTSGTVYRSADLGASWSAVGTLSQVGMTGLVGDDGELVALDRTGLTARSVDGSAWNWVGAVNQVTITALANDEPQAVGVPEHPGDPRPLLFPPRPNPLRAGETLRLAFSQARSGDVRIRLVDARGRWVATREAEWFPAGSSTVRWGLPGLRSGVYFLRLEVPGRAAAATRLTVLP